MTSAIKKWISLLILSLILILPGCQAPVSVPVDDSSASSKTTGELTVWMLDVGQGDSLLIKSPAGKYMLIDGGPGENADQTLKQIKQLGVKEIDWLIVSHGHEDHVGGLAAILKATPVWQAWLSAGTTTTRAYQQMLLALKAGETRVSIPAKGDKITWEPGLIFELIGPWRTDYEDLNDTSLVVRMEWGQTSFLFTGDMTSSAEDDLLTHGQVEPVTVLKVAHHGSNGSSSEQWLKQIKPSLALISAGTDNDYGHPGRYTLERLSKSGIQVLRTDQLGTIKLVSNGKQVRVYWEKKAEQTEETVSIIGNRSSKVYHRADADHLPAAHNQVRLSNVKDAEASGYRACSRCYGD